MHSGQVESGNRGPQRYDPVLAAVVVLRLASRYCPCSSGSDRTWGSSEIDESGSAGSLPVEQLSRRSASLQGRPLQQASRYLHVLCFPSPAEALMAPLTQANKFPDSETICLPRTRFTFS